MKCKHQDENNKCKFPSSPDICDELCENFEEYTSDVWNDEKLKLFDDMARYIHDLVFFNAIHGTAVQYPIELDKRVIALRKATE